MAELPQPAAVHVAAAATFADEQLRHPRDHEHFFERLPEIATKLGEAAAEGAIDFDVTRVTQYLEYHDGRPVEKGAARRVTTGADITGFLESMGGHDYGPVRGRTEMLTLYDQTFKPRVAGIREALQDPDAAQEPPDVLGHGSNSTAVRIRVDDKDYVAKVPNGGHQVSAVAIDRVMAGAVLGRGIPRLEQVVAADYNDGIIVSELLPGKPMGEDMTLEDIAAITDEQLAELVDTVTAAHESGVDIDPKPSNVLYDHTEGFGIIDYGSIATRTRRNDRPDDTTLGGVVGSMVTPIMRAGFTGRPPAGETTVADYARDAEFYRANLGVLERYRKVVAGRLTGDELDRALEIIDSRIQSTRDTIAEHEDPAWVDERVTRDALNAAPRGAEPPRTGKAGDDGMWEAPMDKVD